MARALALLAAAALATAPASAHELMSASMLWNATESYAVFTGTTVARQKAGPPSFGYSTWLNQPIEASSVDANGSPYWTFQASSNFAIFGLDSARHAVSAFGNTALDTFVGEVVMEAPFACTLYGFASKQTSSTPAWTYTIPQCSGDFGTGGSYQALQASDDGSTVVFAAYANQTTPSGEVMTARAWILDGQTGKLLFEHNLGPDVQPNQGQVQVNADGSAVLHIVEPTAYVLERDSSGSYSRTVNVTVPYFIGGSISDSGDYLALANIDQGQVYTRDADGGFKLTSTLSLPPSQGQSEWIPWDITISTDDSTDELVVFACISPDVLQLRIAIFSLTTGALLTDYYTEKNTQLQNNPTVRADRGYVGIAMWGDNGPSGDGNPTAVVIKAGSNTSLLSFVSPGSQFVCDIVVDSTSPTQDAVYFTTGGKAVPANAYGNGGNAYGWELIVSKE